MWNSERVWFSLGRTESFSQSYYRPDSDEDLAPTMIAVETPRFKCFVNEQTEWKALSAMNGAGLITFRDKCVENCHVVDRCGQCMKKQEKVVAGEIDEVEDGENSTSDDDLEQEEQEEA